MAGLRVNPEVSAQTAPQIDSRRIDHMIAIMLRGKDMPTDWDERIAFHTEVWHKFLKVADTNFDKHAAVTSLKLGQSDKIILRYLFVPYTVDHMGVWQWEHRWTVHLRYPEHKKTKMIMQVVNTAFPVTFTATTYSMMNFVEELLLDGLDVKQGEYTHELVPLKKPK